MIVLSMYSQVQLPQWGTFVHATTYTDRVASYGYRRQDVWSLPILATSVPSPATKLSCTRSTSVLVTRGLSFDALYLNRIFDLGSIRLPVSSVSIGNYKIGGIAYNADLS